MQRLLFWQEMMLYVVDVQIGVKVDVVVCVDVDGGFKCSKSQSPAPCRI